MNDQQLALQAIGEAELLPKQYLRPCSRPIVRILDRVVELGPLDLIVAAIRLQQRSG
jgi:hypothetical protein